jgi:hypothetical protein
MATKKIYQLKAHMQLFTHFKVGANVVGVTFQGGTRKPYLVRGRFYTADPDLQKAIESDVSFGTLFYLEKSEEDDTPQPAKRTPPAINKVAPANEGGNNSQSASDNGGSTTDYPEITTVKDAKAKLMELFPEIKPANIPNQGALLNKAKMKGITFSKLV